LSLDATIEQAKDLFAELGAVSHRKMFGGAGLYAEGVMFGLVLSDEIMLKATGDFADALKTRGSTPFVYEGKSKPVAMSYWRVPETAFDDPDEALDLAQRALGCAHEAKA
jgi:DNA transformation protein